MSSPCIGLLDPSVRRRRSRWRVALLALPALALPACRDSVEPLPQPFPPNIEITASPAPGSTVDAAAAQRVELRFSRSMDPASLLQVTKMSFLLPLTVQSLVGRWNDERTAVVFDLTHFPIQPGTLYEAVFTGLRTADGDYYNLGPYRVWFRTRGQPDLMPMQPQTRLVTREFCHRTRPDSARCSWTSTLTSRSIGVDSLELRLACETCGGKRDRRDLFRARGGRIEWLGFDERDARGTVVAQARWPEPPPLLALPAREGNILESGAQTAPTGTRLLRWKSRTGGVDQPAHVVAAPLLAIQIVFSDSRLVDLEYALEDPQGRTETRKERWWLYPGVGLVRREIRARSSDLPGETYELQSFTPSVSSLSR